MVEEKVETSLDVQHIRKDFPILNTEQNGKPYIYLDNGATTQKPKAVIDAISKFYEETNSNIHRGVHRKSEEATLAYENARETVQQFINAKHKQEVIFTYGTTSSINIVASSFGDKYIGEGDEVLVTEMEHHANIVPWQMLCARKGAVLKYVPINDAGELQLDKVDELLTERTKIFAFTYVSNALGTVNPVTELVAKAKAKNIPVLLDAAQAIQHYPIDVQALGVDFLAFSGHKLYAPTGIGVLWGKKEWLNEMPPYMGGGDMIESVSFSGTSFAALPFKFEAGTTNYVGAHALAVAIEYIRNIGLDKIAAYEKELLDYATEKMSAIEGLTIYGKAKNKSAVISFLLDGAHAYDVGLILDQLGIAVRTGTHCAEPVMQRLGIPGTARAVFNFYNTKEEVDALVKGIERAKRMLI